MAVVSLTEIYNAIVSGVQAVNNLNQTLARLPATTASSSPPSTSGAISFSSSLADGFVLLTTSSGATVKVAFYSNP